MIGISARGRKELENHLAGKRLTAKQAAYAKCYDCMGGFVDGKVDCGVTGCPLYGYMPYGSRKYAPKKQSGGQADNLIKARAAKSKINTI